MPFRLMAALAVSAMVALLLSFVPAGQHLSGPKAHLPAFRQTDPVPLGKQNLVDLFTLAPSHYNIKRVTWDKGALTVDYGIKAGEGIDISRLYRDWYGLTYRSLTHTSNVNVVTLRLWEAEGEEKSRLLLTWKADRARHRSLPDPSRVSDVQTFVERMFVIQPTPEFTRKVRPPS